MLALLDPQLHPVVGHRGNRAHAPENTLVSFREAMALGVDALEFDLHLSRDGVPVVMHDPTLERTTSGRGPVAALTVAELRQVDAGARFSADGGRSFPFKGRGVTIPTLGEVLEATGTLPLIIEMKCIEVARPALAVIERAGALGRVLIGSFLDESLVPFQEAGVPVSAAPCALTHLYLPALLGARPRSLPFQSMCLPRFHHGIPVPVRQYSRLMRSLGRTVHVWTVNDPRRALSLWANGVNGIISDDPGTIIEARRRLS